MLKKIKSIIPLWLKVAVLHIVSDVKNYSFRVMIAHVYFDYVTYNKIEDKYAKAYEMRHKTVLAYLRKKGNHIINEYKNSETPAKALHNVEVVISEWLETATELGREIPEPKGRLKYA